MRSQNQNLLRFAFGGLFTLLGAGCSAAAPGPSGTEAAPAAVAPGGETLEVSAKSRDDWRRAVTKGHLPEDGCFQLTHPSTTWVRVPCTTPPARPFRPASGAVTETVGNGNDSTAATANVISWAEGSFPSVSGVTSENDDGTANDYSLQLNSQPFTGAGLCNGAQNSATCEGWEQFIYIPGFTFIQYWLLDYNNTCPTGWNTFGVDCWKNSTNGAIVPAEPVTSLASMTLTGAAGASDSVVTSVGNGTLYSYSQASVLNLNTHWHAAEFNVVGDGNGSAATFNIGSTIAVQTLTDIGGTTGSPTCSSQGFTGETNNLTILPGSCGAFGGDLPGILFTESNATGATAFAHPETAELGFERIKGDFNGDGVEDVIIVNASGSFEYLGRLAGGFTANAWVRNDLPLDAVNYVAGDFNGDGKTDLIIVTAGGSFEYTGLAGGGFTPNVWTRTDLKLGVVSYVPGDFNGDGKTDVVIVTAGGSFEYTGLAAGGFTPNVWTQTNLTLGTVNYVPGDFNGDGKTDLIVVTPGGSVEDTGLAAGGFTANVWTRSDLTLGIANYAAGDFNGDGKTDVIIVTPGGSFEYTGLAAGGFTPNVWTRTDLVNDLVVYEARDFNGDGKTDFIVQTPTGSYEYTGLAAGGFTPNVWTRTDLPSRTTSYF